ncbi:hypothetical protein Ga0100231_022895 [Opitutaceae bacterium TAV4]|nr:hypothetical protein Ga0100231_022895 [Opitutaceae bacterium TAV4]
MKPPPARPPPPPSKTTAASNFDVGCSMLDVGRSGRRPAPPLGHRMILASAGSGKTYALTNRFVQLLARGAPPERIVALTFTRKAAGEFTDEILKKLATAATDPATAARLASEIFPPPPPPPRPHPRCPPS